MAEHTAHWYAIQVRPKSERVVCRYLQALQIEHLYPTLTTDRRNGFVDRDYSPPLFAGYLFIHLSWATGPRLYHVPHVIRILSFGRTPTPVDDREIDAIRLVATSKEERMPWAPVSEGEVVTVIDGPLRGLEGTFVQDRNRNLVVISVSLLHKAMAVVVDRQCIAKSSAPKHLHVYTVA